MTNKLVKEIMSNRLVMISSSVKKCNLLYDIGTDHAYVPIDLLQEKKCEIVYATDVKKGPLQIANKNIQKYNLQNNIFTRIGNGLDVISEKPDCIIIAGMGGILISQLITNNLEKAMSANQLIIQAMNAEEIIRKILIEKGFEIEFEKLVKEGKKIYNLISARYTDSKVRFDEFEYYTSKYLINQKDKLLIEYLKPKVKRLNDIVKGQKIEKCVDKNIVLIKERLEEIINENT